MLAVVTRYPSNFTPQKESCRMLTAMLDVVEDRATIIKSSTQAI